MTERVPRWISALTCMPGASSRRCPSRSRCDELERDECAVAGRVEWRASFGVGGTAAGASDASGTQVPDAPAHHSVLLEREGRHFHLGGQLFAHEARVHLIDPHFRLHGLGARHDRHQDRARLDDRARRVGREFLDDARGGCAQFQLILAD